MLKWPGSNRVQFTCNTSSADLMQHVVCHVVRRDSSVINLDSLNRVYFSSVLLAESLNQ